MSGKRSFHLGPFELGLKIAFYWSQCYVADSITGNSLRERLRTHKVFTKKQQFFYLDYQKFSLKSYVVDVY